MNYFGTPVCLLRFAKLFACVTFWISLFAKVFTLSPRSPSFTMNSSIPHIKEYSLCENSTIASPLEQDAVSHTDWEGHFKLMILPLFA